MLMNLLCEKKENRPRIQVRSRKSHASKIKSLRHKLVILIRNRY